MTSMHVPQIIKEYKNREPNFSDMRSPWSPMINRCVVVRMLRAWRDTRRDKRSKQETRRQKALARILTYLECELQGVGWMRIQPSYRTRTRSKRWPRASCRVRLLLHDEFYRVAPRYLSLRDRWHLSSEERTTYAVG